MLHPDKEFAPETIMKIVEYAKQVTDSNQWKAPIINDYPEIKRILLNLSGCGDDFVNYMFALFGNIRLVLDEEGNVNIEETLKPSNFRCSYRNRIWEKEDILIYMLFLAKVRWSLFNTGTARTKPINSGTPLFLWAQKHFNDVSYGKWQKYWEPKYTGGFLGQQYVELANIKPEDIPTYTLEEISQLRLAMVTGKLKNVPHVFNYYDWKFNKTGEAEFDDLPDTLRMMLGQIWIWNSQCRNRSTLTDWIDWDNTPEPLDFGTTPKITIKQVSKHITDEMFDSIL